MSSKIKGAAILIQILYVILLSFIMSSAVPRYVYFIFLLMWGSANVFLLFLDKQINYLNNCLSEQKNKDSLTNTYNRQYMNKFYKSIYLDCMKENNKLSILLIDMNNLAVYNAKYGHLFGDKCLKYVARTICAICKRHQDFICRYSSSTFAVFLSDTDLDGAKIIANKIIKNIRSIKIHLKNHKKIHPVSVSIGIVSDTACLIDNEKTMSRAESALDNAKKTGENKVSVFT